MERSFGYRQEAQRWRQEVAEKRGELVRRQIAEVMMVIDRHIRWLPRRLAGDSGLPAGWRVRIRVGGGQATGIDLAADAAERS